MTLAGELGKMKWCHCKHIGKEEVNFIVGAGNNQKREGREIQTQCQIGNRRKKTVHLLIHHIQVGTITETV